MGVPLSCPSIRVKQKVVSPLDLNRSPKIPLLPSTCPSVPLFHWITVNILLLTHSTLTPPCFALVVLLCWLLFYIVASTWIMWLPSTRGYRHDTLVYRS